MEPPPNPEQRKSWSYSPTDNRISIRSGDKRKTFWSLKAARMSLQRTLPGTVKGLLQRGARNLDLKDRSGEVQTSRKAMCPLVLKKQTDDLPFEDNHDICRVRNVSGSKKVCNNVAQSPRGTKWKLL